MRNVVRVIIMNHKVMRQVGGRSNLLDLPLDVIFGGGDSIIVVVSWAMNSNLGWKMRELKAK